MKSLFKCVAFLKYGALLNEASLLPLFKLIASSAHAFLLALTARGDIYYVKQWNIFATVVAGSYHGPARELPWCYLGVTSL